MYSTCLFCHGDLGANEAVEHFPVGRRLAFDAAKGRLWVVCPRCGRWNLTPLEERWEAIEECERRFRDARRRFSGDNVGLAALPDGLALIRVGNPLRAELAHWRYGRAMVERWHRARWGRLASEAGMVAWPAVMVLPGAIYAAGIAGLAYMVADDLMARRVVVRLPLTDGGRLSLDRDDVREVRLLGAAVRGGWELEVSHREGVTTLQGREAVRAGGRLLATLSRSGAPADLVNCALDAVQPGVAPDVVFRRAADELRRAGYVNLIALPNVSRLALEMIAHEEEERRAMEGELAELERAWRDAEELAAVADDLLLPRSVRERLARLRGRG